jgi:hypothetical protein
MPVDAPTKLLNGLGQHPMQHSAVQGKEVTKNQMSTFSGNSRRRQNPFTWLLPSAFLSFTTIDRGNWTRYKNWKQLLVWPWRKRIFTRTTTYDSVAEFIRNCLFADMKHSMRRSTYRFFTGIYKSVAIWIYNSCSKRNPLGFLPWKVHAPDPTL